MCVLTNGSPLSVVKCEDPRVENGRKTSGFGLPYRYKDSVVFECNQGYVMVGEMVITCEENNTWVPPKPTCEKSKTFCVKFPFLLCVESVLAKAEHSGVLVISWVKAGEKMWNTGENT